MFATVIVMRCKTHGGKRALFVYYADCAGCVFCATHAFSRANRAQGLSFKNHTCTLENAYSEYPSAHMRPNKPSMSIALDTGDSRRFSLLVTKFGGGVGGDCNDGGDDGDGGDIGTFLLEVVDRSDLTGDDGFKRAKSSADQSGCLSCAMSNAVSPVLVLCTTLAPASNNASTTAGGVSRQKQAYCNNDRLAPCGPWRYFVTAKNPCAYVLHRAPWQRVSMTLRSNNACFNALGVLLALALASHSRKPKRTPIFAIIWNQ